MARLARVQVGSADELELVAAVNGDAGIEKMLHQAFVRDHMRGEWFRRSPVIEEFIRIVKMRKAKYPRG